MKITLLPSAFSSTGSLPHQYLTTYLINDSVAIDAGVLGIYGTPAEQAAVRHVFLSHSHIDHWATLPMFLVNVFDAGDVPVTLHASEAVIDSLRTDVFNGRVWPNFFGISHEGKPFVNVTVLSSGKTVAVEGLRITPIAVDHVVPTLGFVIEDGSATVVISSDTGPTDAIWQRANQAANLKAVFLEATLPAAMQGLAQVTRHLTSASFVAEMAKVRRPAAFYAVHLSARTHETVVAELRAHRLPNLELAQFGRTYEF